MRGGIDGNIGIGKRCRNDSIDGLRLLKIRSCAQPLFADRAGDLRASNMLEVTAPAINSVNFLRVYIKADNAKFSRSGCEGQR